MTAATVTKYFDISDSQIEVVRLTASDGETFVSRKFSTIEAAQISANSDVDAHINVTYSSRTATINWASQTDKVCTLTLYGNLGN